MRKTVIANWGQAGQGKSDTIKRVARIILENNPNGISNPIDIDYSHDIMVIITIGKIKIGIESQGDPNSRLFPSLEEFVRINCQIIICATRTSGATVEAVSALHASNGYDIVWATNLRSQEKNHEELNETSAQHIVAIIQRLIDGSL